MSPAIKGIVFDKDGTLFDFDRTWGPVTGRLIAEECNHDPNQMKALAEVLQFDLVQKVFLPGSLVIASTAERVEEAVLPFTPDGNLTALRGRMRAATSSVAQVQVTDLQRLFAGLKARGLALGIATNDSLQPALANLNDAGVRGMFDFIAGYDSGFGSKPETGQLDAFCQSVGLSASECVMVGDSLHDLRAGAAARMRCVGVLTGPAPQEELAPHADVVLDSIADLPDWLDAQNGG